MSTAFEEGKTRKYKETNQHKREERQRKEEEHNWKDPFKNITLLF